MAQKINVNNVSVGNGFCIPHLNREQNNEEKRLPWMPNPDIDPDYPWGCYRNEAGVVVYWIRLSIYQPRRENISTFEMSKEDLLRWADEVLAPTAKLAYDGEGEFCAGAHCIFCKAKANCRKRAEENMAMAKYDFVEASTLSPEDIAEILPKIEQLTEWADDIKNYALSQALSGTRYPGFKVVEGRSTRKYRNEAEVARIVSEAGYDPFERKLMGITAMTRQLGKQKFETLLAGQLIRPQGKPVLVPETDERPEFSTAANDFMED